MLNVFSRWYFIKYGYKFGINLVKKINESNLIEKFVEGATIIGLMVTAAMIVSFVKVPIAVAWNFAGKKIVLQELLDKILPGLVPLLISMLYYSILNKTKKGNYICLLLSFVIGILGKVSGIL